MLFVLPAGRLCLNAKDADGLLMEKFFNALGGYYSIKKNRPMTAEEISLYRSAFSNWPDGMLAAAVTAHVTDPEAGMYDIQPAHIMKHLQRMIGPQGERAWQIALKAAREHGCNDDVKFEDGLIAQAIQDCGGWKAICMESNQFRLDKMRERFIASYERSIQFGLQGPPPDVFRGSLQERRLKIVSDAPSNLLAHNESKKLERMQ